MTVQYKVENVFKNICNLSYLLVAYMPFLSVQVLAISGLSCVFCLCPFFSKAHGQGTTLTSSVLKLMLGRISELNSLKNGMPSGMAFSDVNNTVQLTMPDGHEKEIELVTSTDKTKAFIFEASNDLVFSEDFILGRHILRNANTTFTYDNSLVVPVNKSMWHECGHNHEYQCLTHPSLDLNDMEIAPKSGHYSNLPEIKADLTLLDDNKKIVFLVDNGGVIKNMVISCDIDVQLKNIPGNGSFLVRKCPPKAKEDNRNNNKGGSDKPKLDKNSKSKNKNKNKNGKKTKSNDHDDKDPNKPKSEKYVSGHYLGATGSNIDEYEKKTTDVQVLKTAKRLTRLELKELKEKFERQLKDIKSQISENDSGSHDHKGIISPEIAKLEREKNTADNAVFKKGLRIYFLQNKLKKYNSELILLHQEASKADLKLNDCKSELEIREKEKAEKTANLEIVKQMIEKQLESFNQRLRGENLIDDTSHRILQGDDINSYETEL